MLTLKGVLQEIKDNSTDFERGETNYIILIEWDYKMVSIEAYEEMSIAGLKTIKDEQVADWLKRELTRVLDKAEWNLEEYNKTMKEVY